MSLYIILYGVFPPALGAISYNDFYCHAIFFTVIGPVREDQLSKGMFKVFFHKYCIMCLFLYKASLYT